MSFQLFSELNWVNHRAKARKTSGSPFHADGPAYENARSARSAACDRSTMMNGDRNVSMTSFDHAQAKVFDVKCRTIIASNYGLCMHEHW